MANVIKEKQYGSQAIRKLSDLDKMVSYIIQSVSDTPTRYGSFVTTVLNEETDQEHKIYMPKHFAKEALPGKVFEYTGSKKSASSGYNYNNIEWIEQ